MKQPEALHFEQGQNNSQLLLTSDWDASKLTIRRTYGPEATQLSDLYCKRELAPCK